MSESDDSVVQAGPERMHEEGEAVVKSTQL